MQQVEWLDLPLWDAIQAAMTEPEDADLASLWQEVEAAIVPLDCSGQLQVAGEAIVRITDVFEARSLQAFEEIQATTSHDGPVMPQDAFDCYVRQTMQVDFEQFIEPLPSLPRKTPDRQANQFPGDGCSVVAVLDKETLLQALEEETDSDLDSDAMKQKLLDIAHAEDIEVWVRAIANCFGNAKAECLTLAQLVREVQDLVAPENEVKGSSPLVNIWLALLLGGFQLEQRLGFYDFEGIWVWLKQ